MEGLEQIKAPFMLEFC